jgi:hypothetical protein
MIYSYDECLSSTIKDIFKVFHQIDQTHQEDIGWQYYGANLNKNYSLTPGSFKQFNRSLLKCYNP